MTYVDRTNEIGIAGHDRGQPDTEHDGKDPGSNKPLNGLLRRYSNKLRSAEGDSADVSKDIVGNDQGRRQKEPDHAFKNIVHDKMCLDHDEV